MNKFAEKRDRFPSLIFFTAFCFANVHLHDAALPEEISHFYSTVISYRQKERRSQNPLVQNWVWNDVALRKISSDPHAILKRDLGIFFPKWKYFPPWNVEKNNATPSSRCIGRGNCAVFRGPFLTSRTSSRSSLERSITRSCRMVSDILNALQQETSLCQVFLDVNQNLVL